MAKTGVLLTPSSGPSHLLEQLSKLIKKTPDILKLVIKDSLRDTDEQIEAKMQRDLGGSIMEVGYTW